MQYTYTYTPLPTCCAKHERTEYVHTWNFFYCRSSYYPFESSESKELIQKKNPRIVWNVVNTNPLDDIIVIDTKLWHPF